MATADHPRSFIDSINCVELNLLSLSLTLNSVDLFLFPVDHFHFPYQHPTSPHLGLV